LNGSPLPQFSQNVRAIVLMIISVGLLAGVDSVVKIAGREGMHPVQIVFFRNLFGLLALAPYFMRFGFGQMRTKRLKMHFLRGAIHVTAMISWFWALTLIPLAEATALGFMAPAYIAIGAILFMGERSHLNRWIAILIGFAGMLVILRPGFIEISLGAALVIYGTIAISAAKILAKSLTRTDAPTAIVAYWSLIVTFLSFFPALFFWSWPSWELLAWLAVVGVISSLGHITMTVSYRDGDLTAVEPATFFRLIWAALFGYFFFAEIPELWTWIGSAIIITGALMLMRSERDRKAAD